MIAWLLLAVTGLVSGAPGREQHSLPRETRVLYARTIATSILSRTPPGARLIGARGDLPPLVDRLIHNATSIRRNIVDTFSCNGRVYGYYADQDNDCQIFHICVPMQQLFPDLYGPEDLYHFSFICPGYTIFSQDSMTCDWEDSAFPCPQAPQLYHRNNHFFVVPAEDVQRTSSTPSSAPALRSQNPSPNPTSAPSSTPFPSRRNPSPIPSPNLNSDSQRSSPIPSSSFTPNPTPTPNTNPFPSSQDPSPSPIFTRNPRPIPINRIVNPTIATSHTSGPNPASFRRNPRPIALRRNLTPKPTPRSSPTPSSRPNPSSSPNPTISPIPSPNSNPIPFRRSPTPIPLSLNLNPSHANSPSSSFSPITGLSSESSSIPSSSPAPRRPPSYRLRVAASRRRSPIASSAPKP